MAHNQSKTYLEHTAISPESDNHAVRYVQKAGKGLLALGACITEAAMSYHGLHHSNLLPQTGLFRHLALWSSAVSAGSVESEVYLGNIENAHKKSRWHGNYIGYQLAFQQADNYLTEGNEAINRLFTELKQNPATEKHRLKLIRHLFAHYINGQLNLVNLDNSLHQKIHDTFKKINLDITGLNKDLTRRQTLHNYLIWVLGIPTGVITAMVNMAGLASCATFIGLSGPAGWCIAVPFGVLTFIAWAHPRFSITSNKLAEVLACRPWQKIQRLWHEGAGGRLKLLIYGAAATLAFTVGAFLLYSLLHQITNIINAWHLGSIAANSVWSMMYPCLALTAMNKFLFYCSNVLHSTKELIELFGKMPGKISDKWSKFAARNDKAWLMTIGFVNLPLLISKITTLPCTLLLLEAHTVSFGFMNGNGNSGQLYTVTSTSAFENLNDAHYVFDSHHHGGSSPPFKSEDHTHYILNVLNDVIKIPLSVFIVPGALIDFGLYCFSGNYTWLINQDTEKPSALAHALDGSFELLTIERPFTRLFTYLGWQVPNPADHQTHEHDGHQRQAHENNNYENNNSHYREQDQYVEKLKQLLRDYECLSFAQDFENKHGTGDTNKVTPATVKQELEDKYHHSKSDVINMNMFITNNSSQCHDNAQQTEFETQLQNHFADVELPDPSKS